MAATVLVPLANGCEELEAVTVIDLLRRANITVITASLTANQEVTASRNVRLVADTTLDKVDIQTIDMLVLPGGQPGADNLNQDARIHQWLQQLHQQGKLVAAICAAPLVLASAGLLSHHRATSYPGVLTADKHPDIILTDANVEIDNRIITSKGPGTAIDFALTLIEHLTDKNTRHQVEAGLVRPEAD